MTVAIAGHTLAITTGQISATRSISVAPVVDAACAPASSASLGYLAALVDGGDASSRRQGASLPRTYRSTTSRRPAGG
jgi:hypothetical protein